MRQHFSTMNGEVEDELDLRQIWIVLRRRRVLILTCLAVALGVVSAITFRTVPVYEAATAIRIDTKESPLSGLDIFRSVGTASEVATEMEVLRTRTLAEAVIDSLGLRLHLVEPRRIPRSRIFDYARIAPHAPEAEYTLEREGENRFGLRNRETGEVLGSYGPGERIDVDGAVLVLAPDAVEHRKIRFSILARGDAVHAFQSATTVTRPNREANIVVVRHQSPDTELVQIVPNTLADLFIAQRRELRKTEARSTIDFLQEQIDTLSQQLLGAEDALQRFREGGQIVSLQTEASEQVRELTQLQAQRNQLDAERAALEALLAEVRALAPEPGGPSPYRRLIGFPSLFRNQAASALLQSLTTVENERTELLKRRTFKDPDVQILTARIYELEEQLRVIAVTYLQGLTNQVVSLDATLRNFGNELAKIPAKEVQLARLARQTTVLEEIYTLLQTRLKEAEIAEAAEDVSVRVVDPAVAPTRPVKPRKMLNLLLGGMLGLMIGIGAAFVREFTDIAVRTREEVEEIAAVPVLGMIPRIRGVGRASANGRRAARRAGRGESPMANGTFEARLIAGRDPRNSISEAYRSLRTNLSFANPDRTPKTLVFTSALPGDGKSTSSANLAVTLAQQGLRCLLVDADLRRGTLHSVLGVAREPGLANVLVGRAELEDVIQTVELDGAARLDFIPCGPFPPNPAELLGHDAMRALLERLSGAYDAVILDAPPLAAVTDAALLSANADGVVVVVRAAKTPRDALALAMEQLRNVRAPVLGAILNDVDFDRDGYYGGYGYYQYYDGASEDGTRRGLRGLFRRGRRA